ncbi:MAG: hypothetical protein BWY88_00700 [Synergistetes bacterium ADurb.Bin520]|nr:MAG: hypothetical protein BWY88_00700 [Synergistetes bacterium ADurb.Bin520]
MIVVPGEAAAEGTVGMAALLHGLPEVGSDQGGVGVLDEDIAALADAEVGAVAEEGRKDVLVGEQTGGGKDVLETGPGSTHLPGAASGAPGVWVGNPAADLALFALDLDLEHFGKVAAGRKATRRIAQPGDGLQAALGVFGNVGAVLLGLPLEDGLIDRGKVRLGDVVTEKDEGVATAAEIGLVELAVEQVAGKALQIPDQDAVNGRGLGAGP